ncbi:feline leukemia virus subgroup C receptor-related protein 2-like isoform X1 [Argiope bruennichi]|uniref:feline leukemia virus subgroup C receptor-related protein 2-like isoform X1 n=2 Tax=Argiope bruennichi TaxID=94029 RepID=UPI00249574BC|nr:feline leukemia virus subgroup C receptor-related protein 2-like isoform X1 [Argiope bruennichi]
MTGYQRFYPHHQKNMEDYQKSGPKAGCFEVNFYSKNISSQHNNDPKIANVTGTLYNTSPVDSSYSSADKHKSSDKSIVNVEKAIRKQSCSHDIRLYRRRFLMLFLFALCSMMNGFPQFQYTVVADIVACYYDVSLSDVNWTCVVYMVLFLPLVFPVMYLMDKKGLKITLVIGAILNFLGSWVQCFSFSTDRYLVIMACQTIYALGQVFVLSLPPFIAGVWFGAGEVGLACAMGVFGNQLGIALGFIIPPTIMTNNCTDQVDISYELSIIAYPMAAINTIILVVIIFVFQERPKLFPSIAQATKPTCKTNYAKSLKKLFNDMPFVLLLLGYGLITGTYFAISTLMNEMVLIHFPGEEVDAGWMGAIMVFAGMIGSIILGALLDKTHKYKSLSLMAFIASFLSMVAYLFLIRLEKIWIQFLMFGLLGFIMTGYLPAGFDFGAEITYPEPEAMSASLLNASTQIFSIILTNIASPLLQIYGDFSSNIFFCACLLVGTIIMACMKCELKRTNADQDADDTKPQ